MFNTVRFQNDQWENAFELLCLSLNSSVDDSTLINATTRVTRWDWFIQQVAWHRLATPVWIRLAPLADCLPGNITNWLKDNARATAINGIRQTEALLRLSNKLLQNQVNFLVLKGVPLAAELYGDIGRRPCKDIDILITEPDVDRVHEILLAMGYARVVPSASFPPMAMQYYMEFRKDFTYRNRRTGVTLELHWRLSDTPHLLSVQRFQSFIHTKSYLMAGIQVPVLSREYNVLYLVMHIAKSSWAKLFWLCDIARLLQMPVDWYKVMKLAQQNGLTDILWVSIQAAHRLLGVPLPVAFAEISCRPSLVARCLLTRAESCVRRASYPDDVTYYFQDLFLSRRLRYRLYHLFYRGAFSLNDIALLPLPRYLFFLYPLLRPLLWVRRRIIPGSKDQVGFRPKG